MPINVYTGLMRSGKSYEVVSEVILPAVRSGRRVVTNVDGISEEKIYDYLVENFPNEDEDKFGTIVHVTNTQVFDSEFFPYYDDHKGAHTDTLVQPGDLVCIDEAWRFWGATDCKLHKNHKSFFLEHGHFTHEKTKVACDLVLMIQDMSNLHRFVKSVVAFNFRTHKKVALGMSNTYSLTMWEGHKQSRTALCGNWVRKYRKDIFPLYSSFSGGAQGVMVNADKRMNIFMHKKLWIYLLLLIGGGGFSAYNAWKFFHPQAPTKPNASSDLLRQSAGTAEIVPTSNPARSPVHPVYSEVWRISGSFYARGKAWVAMTNAAGDVRIESPSAFSNSGLAQTGDIDGLKVTSWSRESTAKSGSGAATPKLPTSPTSTVGIPK